MILLSSVYFHRYLFEIVLFKFGDNNKFMEQIATLRSAWLFDTKGNVKQIKNEADRSKAKQVYQRAREALRYTRSIISESPFKRLSFINGKEEWTITITVDNEIIVMHKDESLA